MNRAYTVVGRILGIAPEEITDATSPKTVASWDSYNGLMLVSALEQEFGVSFTLDEVIAVQNVGDITAALTRHGIEV
ncbi:MAG: acyl carrier protein [bacterium]|nr:acyl carrier protein [bacterium]